MPIFDMAKYSFVVRTKRYRDIANLSQLPAENDLMSYNNYGYNAVERRRGFSNGGTSIKILSTIMSGVPHSNHIWVSIRLLCRYHFI